MSNKKERKRRQLEVFDTKKNLLKFMKRYGIILLIATPIIVIFNYIMGEEISWYSTLLTVIVTIVLYLLAMFIGIVVYTKIDDKREMEMTPEKQRDPFAD